jgi:hypothetical protein
MGSELGCAGCVDMHSNRLSAAVQLQPFESFDDASVSEPLEQPLGRAALREVRAPASVRRHFGWHRKLIARGMDLRPVATGTPRCWPKVGA